MDVTLAHVSFHGVPSSGDHAQTSSYRYSSGPHADNCSPLGRLGCSICTSFRALTGKPKVPSANTHNRPIAAIQRTHPIEGCSGEARVVTMQRKQAFPLSLPTHPLALEFSWFASLLSEVHSPKATNTHTDQSFSRLTLQGSHCGLPCYCAVLRGFTVC